jgi:anti-sigma regulatory factor (Ser/Thr protein kinase)
MTMRMTQAPPEGTAARYRHEALLYSGLEEFLLAAVPFIRRAVERREPVLVVVNQDKIDLLCERLGADADRVEFADMAAVGANPARLIAAWHEFLARHAGAAQLWGIGEPAYPGRSAMELAECQLHEALLNEAFDAATPLWLLCPYDVDVLAADVIVEARRTHPFVAHGEETWECGDFRRVDLADPFDRPMPPRPPGAASLSFQAGDLARLRAFVADQAARAGLDMTSAESLVLAVNEIASNSVRHGGGCGELRAWNDGTFLVCEVSDSGHITAPLVGRRQPPPEAAAGGGLWVANQVCDLVQIYSSARGTVIRACIGVRP